MPEEGLEMLIKLDLGENVEDRQLEQASMSLRDELRRLDDVEKAELPEGGPPPPGTRALETVALGSILVKLAASGGVFTALVGVFRTWLRRDESRCLTLQIGKDKLIMKGHSSQEEQQMFEAFLKRRSKKTE
jgi:hypothetical protein